MRRFVLLVQITGLVASVASVTGCEGIIGELGVGADAAPELPCPDPETFFRDGDGDRFGDPAMSMLACEAPVGFVGDDTDCDDGDAGRNPDAIEVCDDLDNDCSGFDRCNVDLISHFRFDQTGAQVARDDSGNGLDGQLRNGAEMVDGVLRLAGDDDFVEVAHSDAFLLDEGTLIVRFRADDTSIGVQQGLWSKDANGLQGGGHLTMALLADGRLDIRLQNASDLVGNNGSLRATTAAAVTSGEFHFAAFTFGPDGMRLRLDGAQVAQNAYTGGLGETSGGAGNREPFAIGARTVSSDPGSVQPITNPLAGEIGDVRFYRRQLSAQELDELLVNTAP